MVILDPKDDKKWIDELKEGNIRAFEYIYTTFFASLANYADRLLNDSDTARDVVQHVYYKIWENRKTLNISLSLQAYLYKSVYYGCLNTLTHQKNIRQYEQLHLDGLYLSDILQSPEAEVSLWQSDIEKAVREAIDALPDKCREVLVLSKFEGLKNKEIALKLNISEKTVERHMSIAIGRLRKNLDWLLQIFFIISVSDWG